MRTSHKNSNTKPEKLPANTTHKTNYKMNQQTDSHFTLSNKIKYEMNKRKFWLLPLVLCLSFLSPLLSPNEAFNLNNIGGGLKKITAKIPKPTATIERFDIKKISLRDITFTFDVAIHNPYPVSIRLAGVETDFSVEKSRVFHTTTSKGFSLKARGKTLNSFDVTLTYASIIKLIKNYSQKDYLHCDIAMAIIIPLPRTVARTPETVRLSFNLSQMIPALKPKINIVKFKVIPPSSREVEEALRKSADKKVKQADPKKITEMFTSLINGKGDADNETVKPEDLDLKFKVSFDIELENQTKAPLEFNSLQYNFNVNSSPLIDGNSGVPQKKGRKMVLTIVNEFSSKGMSKAVQNAFKAGTGDYLLKGKASLKLPPKIIKHPLNLDFTENGKFNLR